MHCLSTHLYKETEIEYTGKELTPHWIYNRFSIEGDAVVAFTGRTQVATESLVDLKDAKVGAVIYSPSMLHFVAEWFMDSFDQGVLVHQLFISSFYETLLERGIPRLSRRGDDLFYESRKLSVSIATRSPVSVLMHFGVNIRTEGTPVPTSGLGELGLEPFRVASDSLERFQELLRSCQSKRTRVRPRL